MRNHRPLEGLAGRGNLSKKSPLHLSLHLLAVMEYYNYRRTHWLPRYLLLAHTFGYWLAGILKTFSNRIQSPNHYFTPVLLSFINVVNFFVLPSSAITAKIHDAPEVVKNKCNGITPLHQSPYTAAEQHQPLALQWLHYST